jgi:opacity protein-like surface antigen
VKKLIRQIIKIFLLMGLLIPSVANFALAAEEPEEKDVYLGADLNFVSLKIGSESLSTTNMRFKVGLDMFPDLIPQLSLESHFGFDLTEDSANINGFNANLYLNNYLGLYVKASHEFEDVLSIYGLLGFSAAQLKGDTFVLQDRSATSPSLGFGASFGMPFDLEGNVEVMQLISSSDKFDVLLLSFGVAYRM